MDPPHIFAIDCYPGAPEWITRAMPCLEGYQNRIPPAMPCVVVVVVVVVVGVVVALVVVVVWSKVMVVVFDGLHTIVVAECGKPIGYKRHSL
jgi:hypothetical protein